MLRYLPLGVALLWGWFDGRASKRELRGAITISTDDDDPSTPPAGPVTTHWRPTAVTMTGQEKR